MLEGLVEQAFEVSDLVFRANQTLLGVGLVVVMVGVLNVFFQELLHFLG